MTMTNDAVLATNTPPLPVDQQILLAIKKRYDLNPKQKELIFEVESLGVTLNTDNDYFGIVAALDGLKEKAGFDYAIENTYTDRLGRIQHYTLYESRLCKIKIVDKKRFEEAIKSNHEVVTTPFPTSKDATVSYKGILYNLKSYELKYKDGQAMTVSPENREMKFFLYLLRNRGIVCHFKDIAREIPTAGYKSMTSPDEDGVATTHEELLDRDFTDEVSGLKRDFRTLMLSLGMLKKEFSKIIIRVPKLGYKLA